MEIQLKHPFTTAAGQLIQSVKVRRPKVKDLKTAARNGSNPQEQEIGLFAVLTNLTAEDVEEMDMADYSQLQATFSALLDIAGPGVGSVGSAGQVVPVPAQ